jgi:TM2 domain-containing membrane protein YozV
MPPSSRSSSSTLLSSSCLHTPTEKSASGFVDTSIYRLMGKLHARSHVPETNMEVNTNSMRDPGLAAVLSAIIPGVGQFYNGRILAGILWLIITPGLWIGTGGLLGWTAHVLSAYTAYSYARDHRVREA